MQFTIKFIVRFMDVQYYNVFHLSIDKFFPGGCEIEHGGLLIDDVIFQVEIFTLLANICFCDFLIVSA